MDINTLARNIVEQATGEKPMKKLQPDTKGAESPERQRSLPKGGERS